MPGVVAGAVAGAADDGNRGAAAGWEEGSGPAPCPTAASPSFMGVLAVEGLRKLCTTHGWGVCGGQRFFFDGGLGASQPKHYLFLSIILFIWWGPGC